MDTNQKEHGLYRYNPSGQYFARVRFRGKLYRRKLDTDDLTLAKRKLLVFKSDLERTDAEKGNTSFAKVIDDYVATLTGADSTKEKKLAVIEKLHAIHVYVLPKVSLPVAFTPQPPLVLKREPPQLHSKFTAASFLPLTGRDSRPCC